MSGIEEVGELLLVGGLTGSSGHQVRILSFSRNPYVSTHCTKAFRRIEKQVSPFYLTSLENECTCPRSSRTVFKAGGVVEGKPVSLFFTQTFLVTRDYSIPSKIKNDFGKAVADSYLKQK